MAMCRIFAEFHSLPPIQKCTKSSISLLIALVWQINALNSRPEAGSSFSRIEELMLPTDDRGVFVPWGLVFFQDIIHLADSLHLPNHVHLPPNIVKTLGRGILTYESMYNRHCNPIRRAPFAMVTNKQQLTNERIPDPYARQFQVNATIQRSPWLDDDEVAPGLNAELSTMWSQYFHDILAKAPATKPEKISHCHLDVPEILTISEAAFRDANLAKIFRLVQWKRVTEAEWGRAFNYLFPPYKKVLNSTAQNYPECRFYQQWGRMLERLTPLGVATCRDALRRAFDGLMWCPAAGADRIWTTKKGRTDYSFGPPLIDDVYSSRARIYINPRRRRGAWFDPIPAQNDDIGINEHRMDDEALWVDDDPIDPNDVIPVFNSQNSSPGSAHRAPDSPESINYN